MKTNNTSVHKAVEKAIANTQTILSDSFCYATILLLYIVNNSLITFCSFSFPKFYLQGNENLLLYSIIQYSFLLKLLWAPVMDAFSISSIGRRKAWYIPLQCCVVGLFGYLMKCQTALPAHQTATQHQYECFGNVFLLMLVLSMQETNIDAWSLEMVHRQNLAIVPTIQQLGNIFGALLGTTLPNSSLVPVKLVITALEFMSFALIPIMFVVDVPNDREQPPPIVLAAASTPAASRQAEGVIHIYHNIYKLFHSRYIMSFMLILLTSGFGFAIQDAVTPYLIKEETGIHRLMKRQLLTADNFKFVITVFLSLVSIAAIAYFGFIRHQIQSIQLLQRQINRSKPLLFWGLAYKIRLITSLAAVLLGLVTPVIYKIGYRFASFEIYETLSVAMYLFNYLFGMVMGIAQSVFFASIIHSRFTATYFAFFKFLAAFGDKFCSFTVQYLVTVMTMRLKLHLEKVILWNGLFIIGCIAVTTGWLLYQKVFRDRIDRLSDLSDKMWIVNERSDAAVRSIPSSG